MGRYFYLGRRSAAKTQPYVQRGSNSLHRPWRWVAISVGSFVVATVLYLAQSNNLATKGFQLETLRQQIKELRVQNRDLESQALQLQSFQHLSAKISNLHMVPAKDVRYLPDGADAVSRR